MGQSKLHLKYCANALSLFMLFGLGYDQHFLGAKAPLGIVMVTESQSSKSLQLAVISL